MHRERWAGIPVSPVFALKTFSEVANPGWVGIINRDVMGCRFSISPVNGVPQDVRAFLAQPASS